MLRSLAGYVTFGISLTGLALVLAGCGPVSEQRESDQQGRGNKPVPVIGQLIAGERALEQASAPAIQAPTPGALAPIVMPGGRVAVIYRQDAPALRDGQILAIGTELEGTEEEIRKTVPPDRLIVVDNINGPKRSEERR